MTYDWPVRGAVEVNGVRLGRREAGDPAGTPVLLLHGSGSSADTWDRFAPILVAAGHRAIAVDLRGHATSARTGDYALRSLRDDVLGLLEVLDLRDAVLVGHSVGGYAALAAARHRPDRIARLVLEDLAAPPRRAGSMAGVRPVQVLGAVAGILSGGRRHDLRALASILRQLSRPDPHWWARLPGVRHPVLLLSGGPASCIPPGRLAEVTAAIPDARLRTIPVGHRVHSLAPDEFATEVLAFLGKGGLQRSAARGKMPPRVNGGVPWRAIPGCGHHKIPSTAGRSAGGPPTCCCSSCRRRWCWRCWACSSRPRGSGCWARPSWSE